VLALEVTEVGPLMMAAVPLDLLLAELVLEVALMLRLVMGMEDSRGHLARLS
jgi:hypothetical protein